MSVELFYLPGYLPTPTLPSLQRPQIRQPVSVPTKNDAPERQTEAGRHHLRAPRRRNAIRYIPWPSHYFIDHGALLTLCSDPPGDAAGDMR